MIGFCLSVLLAGGQVSSVEAAPAATPKASRTVVLPAGTAVRLVTTGTIDSRSVKQGQRFALRLDQDVTVGHNLVIPRGTAATGEVESVSEKGMFGKGARLVLQPLFIEFGGDRINLAGQTTENGSDGTTAAAIATFITPFGLAITGKSATVPAGAVLLGRIRSDVAIPAIQSPPASDPTHAG